MTSSDASHPSDHELWDHVAAVIARREPPDSSVASHLDGPCEACRERADRLRRVIQELRAPSLTKAPSAWVRDARRHLRVLAADEAPSAGRLERTVAGAARALEEILATLVRDSSAAGALVGARGIASGQARTLMFESALGEVYLRIGSQSNGEVRVGGQFLGTDEAPGAVLAELAVAGVRHRSDVSSDGDFGFEDIPTGAIQVSIVVGERRLVLPIVNV